MTRGLSRSYWYNPSHPAPYKSHGRGSALPAFGSYRICEIRGRGRNGELEVSLFVSVRNRRDRPVACRRCVRTLCLRALGLFMSLHLLASEKQRGSIVKAVAVERQQ